MENTIYRAWKRQAFSTLPQTGFPQRSHEGRLNTFPQYLLQQKMEAAAVSGLHSYIRTIHYSKIALSILSQI